MATKSTPSLIAVHNLASFAIEVPLAKATAKNPRAGELLTLLPEHIHRIGSDELSAEQWAQVESSKGVQRWIGEGIIAVYTDEAQIAQAEKRAANRARGVAA